MEDRKDNGEGREISKSHQSHSTTTKFQLMVSLTNYSAPHMGIYTVSVYIST